MSRSDPHRVTRLWFAALESAASLQDEATLLGRPQALRDALPWAALPLSRHLRTGMRQMKTKWIRQLLRV